MSDQPRGRLRRVGAMWQNPGSKTLGSGTVTVNGLRQRFAIFRNDRKQSDRDPDFVLLSSDEPTVDTYAERPSSQADSARAQPSAASEPADGFVDPVRALFDKDFDDDIPF